MKFFDVLSLISLVIFILCAAEIIFEIAYPPTGAVMTPIIFTVPIGIISILVYGLSTLIYKSRKQK